MTATSPPASAPGRAAHRRRAARAGSLSAASGLGLGVAVLWLSLLVLIPLAMVVASAGFDGVTGFLRVLADSQTLSAVELMVVEALLVTALNVVVGTEQVLLRHGVVEGRTTLPGEDRLVLVGEQHVAVAALRGLSLGTSELLSQVY